MKTLLFQLSLVILTSNIASATKASEVILFGKDALFKSTIAYSRSASTSLYLMRSKINKPSVFYVNGSLGKELPVLTLTGVVWFQIGVEATTWFTLALPREELFFPLLTQDFHVAVPISVKHKNISASIKFNHISAHKGDGLDYFIGKKTKLFSYSREYISLHADYTYKSGIVNNRVYSQSGFSHNIHPENLKRWFIGGGIELEKDLGFVRPFFAQDITWNSDVNTVDLSSKFGFFMKQKKKQFIVVDVGMFFHVYIGGNRSGQLVGKKMNEFGLGILIR